jgi:hypothetical protein
MKNLQTTVPTYNTTQRATKIYQTVVDVFDWDRSSDCVTPLGLALKQLEGVEVGGTLCVPGAGIGTYVLAAIQKGFKPESIYAVELDSKYYELGSAMFERLGVNYILADFLTWQPNMQFDVIVGNPPYQSPNTSGKKGVYKPLWPKFWSRAFALTTDDGYVSFVGPASWCGPTSNLSKDWAINGEIRLWDVFNSYSTVADVDSIHEFFPGVGSTFSVVAVDKSGRDGIRFTNGFDASLGFYPKSGLEEVKANLATEGNIGTNFPGSPGNGKGSPWRVSIVSSRMVREETVEILAEGESPVSNLDPSLYTYVGVNSREQAEYVRSRVLGCRDILNKHCRYYGFICPPALRMITLPDLPAS